VVVNLTKDKVWVRDGIVPDFPSQAPTKFDIAAMGGLIIPAPKNKRQDFQEQSIRDAEIPPAAGYSRQLATSSCTG
jgi:ribonuclease Z